MGGPSVLAVAAWGYPPAWRRARYTVTINHPAFKDAKPVECTTCSTTVALANYLAYKSRHVDVLIFGVDTVSTPGQGKDGGGFRERVKQRYKEWLQTLIETSKGCLTETSREKISWTRQAYAHFQFPRRPRGARAPGWPFGVPGGVCGGGPQRRLLWRRVSSAHAPGGGPAPGRGGNSTSYLLYMWGFK